MRNIPLLFLCFLWFSWSLKAQVDDPELEKVKLSWQLINTFYVDSVASHNLAEEAIVGMLKQLDPHSVYIPPEEVKAMNEPLDGNFEGVGIEFLIQNDTLLVVSVIPGGPSEKVGMKAGDRIIEIDNVNIAGVGLSNQDVFDQLRGPKGTKVRLTVLRGSEKLQFNLVRDEIPIFSLDASYIMDPQTGYIKISRFGQNTHQEFRESLMELKKQEIKNLVLDLRGNGGGYLKAALEIADELIDDHRLLLFMDGMAIPRSEYFSRSGGLWEEGKLIVLIDEGSASASEIVAGAVQDWDRGLIVGRRSFGKGLVQRPFRLQDGAEIRLTIAKYYTPSGRCIQKPYNKGIDQYYSEIFERFVHGELLHSDSIHMPDSLVFRTLNKKRKVYGGGGIVPDVFIPIDTVYFTDYYRDLVASGALNGMVMEWLDQWREIWKDRYPEFDLFMKKFEVEDDFIYELKNKGIENSVEPDLNELEISKPWLKLQIKALIARNLWSTSEYYQTLNPSLPVFSKIMELLDDDNTFLKMFEP